MGNFRRILFVPSDLPNTGIKLGNLSEQGSLQYWNYDASMYEDAEPKDVVVKSIGRFAENESYVLVLGSENIYNNKSIGNMCLIVPPDKLDLIKVQTA